MENIKKFKNFINENDDNYSGIMSGHFGGDDDFDTTDPELLKDDNYKQHSFHYDTVKKIAEDFTYAVKTGWNENDFDSWFQDNKVDYGYDYDDEDVGFICKMCDKNHVTFKDELCDMCMTNSSD